MKNLILLTAALLLTGCASMRGVEVGSGSDGSYAVEVTNNRGTSVTVSYTEGGNLVQLGSVPPNRAERFVIAGNRSANVTIVATTTSGSPIGRYPVLLEAGATTRVTVR